MANKRFSQVIKNEFPLLKQYIPVLARVHGEGHPELAQVGDLFLQIYSKVEEKDLDKLDLSKEFEALRNITDNYLVPEDGCETYAASYEMLELADKVYHS